MKNLTRVVDSFPSIQIPNQTGGLPVEVSLIAQLGLGAGSQLFANVVTRQQEHENFLDQLDEPSVKLGNTNLSLGDSSSFYSFVVGSKGHPFHRHAGKRFFTAISGSSGAQLRFSTASLEMITQDPESFLKSLHYINIPPDCLFTVRFGGETWHQFLPLARNTRHPAFFALSYHADELGGNLSQSMKDKVMANNADIPTLTEVLPASIDSLLKLKESQEHVVPTTTLALDAAAGTVHRKICDTVRSSVGNILGHISAWFGTRGFISHTRLEN